MRSTAFVLAVVGFGSKAGMVPLHVWLPRAHPEAPGPVSALMSAAMVNLGIYGIVRVGDELLGGGPAWWWLLVMALGALSALFGSSALGDEHRPQAAAGLFDHRQRRAHAARGGRLGPVRVDRPPVPGVWWPWSPPCCTWSSTPCSRDRCSSSASSLQQATGTRDLDQLGGLLRRMPITGSLFLVGGLTIAALPPLCGFVSEWLLAPGHAARLPSSDPALAIAMPIGVGALALTGGLTALTFVKAVGIGLLGPTSQRAGRRGGRGPPVDVGRRRHPGHALPGVRRGPVPGHPGRRRRGPQRHRRPRPRPPGGRLAGGTVGHPRRARPRPPRRSGCVVAVSLVAGARRVLQRAAVRRTEAWGCGRELQTARMEYTATSFGEPLTRVFEDVLSPAHDLDVSHVAESRYYVEAARFHTSLDDAFERHVYRPAARGPRTGGGRSPAGCRTAACTATWPSGWWPSSWCWWWSA